MENIKKIRLKNFKVAKKKDWNLVIIGKEGLCFQMDIRTVIIDSRVVFAMKMIHCIVWERLIICSNIGEDHLLLGSCCYYSRSNDHQAVLLNDF